MDNVERKGKVRNDGWERLEVLYKCNQLEGVPFDSPYFFQNL